MRDPELEDHSAMTTRAQFCPVAKAAEVFGDRWTPIIIWELCFGTRSFGELLEAPYIADSAGSTSQAT